MLKRFFTLAFLVCAASEAAAQPAPVTTGPAAPASTTDIDALRAATEKDRDELRRKLDQSLRDLALLRRQLNEEATARRNDSVALREVVRTAQEQHALTVRSGRFGVALSGLVQVDAGLWRQSSVDEVDPSTAQPLNETRFLLRRARLRAVLDYRFLFGSFEIDANTVNGPQVRPISFDVGAQYKNPRNAAVPYIAAHLGMVRTPFGFEVQQSDRDRLFLERSRVMSAFFPGEYDLGARVFGGWRFLRYTVAAMNGDPVGERTFPGRDPNKSKDFVFHGGVDLTFGRVGVRGGFSAVYGRGFHQGIASGKDQLVWRDQNQNGQIDPGEITSVLGQAAQPSANFGRYALGGDLQIGIQVPRLGQLTLLGELVYGVNMDRAVQVADPVAAARDLRELGWYVGATQELTRYALVGLRYDRYDPDRDSTDLRSGSTVPRNQTYSDLVVTAAGRLPGYGRLILEYRHATNALGRSTDGIPTTLADDAFTLRGEIRF